MGMSDYFIFDDIDTRDFEDISVYFDNVDKTPKRMYEVIDIPARNGSFYIDENRYEDVEHVYHIVALTKEAGSAIINALSSKIGYYRLEDSFNPDEFYHAVFTSGADPKIASTRDKNTFKVTFTRKPQRWLKDGETAVTIGEWGETETASGDIVTVENPNGILAVKSLEVDLEPMQDLNGYDKPWVGGAGKNKLNASSGSGTVSGVTFTNTNGVIVASGSATANIYRQVGTFTPENGVEYILTGCPSGGVNGKYRIALGGYGYDFGNGYTFTGDGQSHNISCDVYTGYPTTGTTLTFKPMIRLASESDATWQPYSNICPISGHTSVDVIVSPTTSASDGTTYTTDLGRTVYGGTLDVTSGVLTVDRAMVTIDGDEIMHQVDGSKNCYISMNDMASQADYRASMRSNGFEVIISGRDATVIDSPYWVTGYVKNSAYEGQNWLYFHIDGANSLTEVRTYLASNPLQVVYELATPQTYQLTAQQISLLTGDNNIWSDGAITLEYGQNPSVLFNPTLFESSPLLETAGSGTIGFNGYEIEFEGVPYGEVVIGEKDSYSLSNTVTVTLDTSLLNTNDPIYPEAKECEIRLGLKYIGSKKFGNDSVVSSTNALDAYTSKTNPLLTKKALIMHLFPDLGDGFVYGTAKTITSSAVYTYKMTGDSTVYTETVSVTIAYGGADTYTVSGTFTGTLPSDVSMFSKGLHSPTMYGDSSKPNTDPIFIDCDLGEAYTNEDGVYRSLNQYIDLGSELPKLGVGENEITFDSTITELKVTPRWWKV